MSTTWRLQPILTGRVHWKLCLNALSLPSPYKHSCEKEASESEEFVNPDDVTTAAIAKTQTSSAPTRYTHRNLVRNKQQERLLAAL